MSLRHSYTIIAPLYDAFLAAAGTGLRAASLAQLPQQPRQGGLNILISGIGTGLDLPYLPQAMLMPVWTLPPPCWSARNPGSEICI